MAAVKVYDERAVAWHLFDERRDLLHAVGQQCLHLDLGPVKRAIEACVEKLGGGALDRDADREVSLAQRGEREQKTFEQRSGNDTLAKPSGAATYVEHDAVTRGHLSMHSTHTATLVVGKRSCRVKPALVQKGKVERRHRHEISSSLSAVLRTYVHFCLVMCHHQC